MIKTQNAQTMGVYKESAIDQKKAEADFRLINVNPNVIRWKDGRQETVNKRTLAQLQAVHSWATDF